MPAESQQGGFFKRKENQREMRSQKLKVSLSVFRRDDRHEVSPPVYQPGGHAQWKWTCEELELSQIPSLQDRRW